MTMCIIVCVCVCVNVCVCMCECVCVTTCYHTIKCASFIDIILVTMITEKRIS